MARVLPGTFWIRTYSPAPLSVRCLLGPTPVKVTDGYAKWDVIDRPKRRALTEWVGTNPLTVEVDIIIDYFSDPDRNPGLQCEDDIRDIESMAGLDFDGDVKPPLCLWDANAAHDNSEAAHLRWVIFRIDWNDTVMFTDAGNRVRQGALLTLMQYVEDEFITATGASKNKKKTSQNRSSKKDRYRVKKSDRNLKDIAQKELGNANLWTKIARLNGLRSPNRTKKWPKYLKMPV